MYISEATKTQNLPVTIVNYYLTKCKWCGNFLIYNFNFFESKMRLLIIEVHCSAGPKRKMACKCVQNNDILRGCEFRRLPSFGLHFDWTTKVIYPKYSKH